MTLWPSSVSRRLQALDRKGVGSNPTGVILKILICGLQLLAIACFSDGSIGVSQLWLQRHSFASASLQTSASTGHGMKSMISLGVWRNGSASDSRSEGWEFESLCPHLRQGCIVPNSVSEAHGGREKARTRQKGAIERIAFECGPAPRFV